MEIIRGLHNIRPRHRGCVATIGTFDGVHHGHQMLLAHLKAKSEELGEPGVLITFEPQPREYFYAPSGIRSGRHGRPQGSPLREEGAGGDGGPRGSPAQEEGAADAGGTPPSSGRPPPARLTRFREKVDALRATGIDRVLCIPFNERTRLIPAREVVERFLVEMLGVRYLVVGDDFRFGQNREGDYALLKSLGDELGFGVSHMGTLTFDNERVSSTRIRAALGEGDFELAEKLLGRPYCMMGRVVYGHQLGRTIGVPTANIRLQRYRAALDGIFAVTVDGLGETLAGAASLGVRPTVHESAEPLLEVHILDFDQSIYGRLLTVTFHRRIREERKYPSLETMKAQIERDIADTRSWFEQHPPEATDTGKRQEAS